VRKKKKKKKKKQKKKKKRIKEAAEEELAKEAAIAEAIAKATTEATEAAAKEAKAAEEASVVVYPSAPSLSDIQIISNNVVYDATGNPSVEVVFKVKNSSGQNLKGINARLELL